MNFRKELYEEKLEIALEPVSNSVNNVGNSLDRFSYSYGYVDFGRDSIIKNRKVKKRIVVWEEILKIVDKKYLEKVLVFLIDWYLNIIEDAIVSNYLKISDAIFLNPNFEYTMLKDIYQNVRIGGFRLSILDKWCGFFESAISDIVSSKITGCRYLYKKRAEFVDTILKINSVDFKEFITKRQKNDIDYFYSLIPEMIAKKIGFWGIVFENNESQSFAMYNLKKLNLENCIYEYVSYLYYTGVMDKIVENKKEEYLTQLLKICNTFYNPDIKLDFRD